MASTHAPPTSSERDSPTPSERDSLGLYPAWATVLELAEAQERRLSATVSVWRSPIHGHGVFASVSLDVVTNLGHVYGRPVPRGHRSEEEDALRISRVYAEIDLLR
eukprot:COSAG02_NODE_19985_length_854_cov_0.811921_1_plen_105_part_01